MTQWLTGGAAAAGEWHVTFVAARAGTSPPPNKKQASQPHWTVHLCPRFSLAPTPAGVPHARRYQPGAPKAHPPGAPAGAS